MSKPKTKAEILYDSDVESETSKQQEPITEVVKPQNTQQDAPKQWDNFVNDDIEKPTKTAKITKQQQDLFTCQYCKKGFCRNYYLNRHLDEGRCSVKRSIDVSKEIELKALEQAINAKLQKQELRREKKALKEQNKLVEQPVKPVVEKPIKPVVPRAEPKQNKQVAEPPQQTTNRPRYIINF